MAESLFDGFSEDFKQEYLSTFTDSFNFSVDNFGINVQINNTPKKVLLKNISGTEKEISANLGDIEIGDIVTIDENLWMITDLPINNLIFKKAVLKCCNTIYPVKQNIKITYNGIDDDGRPISKETFDIVNRPCIATPTYPTGTKALLNEQLPLPDGLMDITLTYQKDDNISLNQKFKIYNQSFEIINIDYTKIFNDKGIIVIRGKREVV